jgi:hypothetical protein
MKTMPSALAFRRFAIVAAPVVAALLIVAGFFLDPAIDKSGLELAREYAASPGREQVSALAFHFAFALLAIPTVALISAVRGRGAWIANLAGFFAFLGMTTLPGFLLTDFYDIAIYGELGGDAWQVVNDRIESLPGATVMFLTALIGFTLALPVALLAAWRASLLSWWPAALSFAGTVAMQAVPGGFGLLVEAAVLVAVAYALWRLQSEAAGEAPRP